MLPPDVRPPSTFPLLNNEATSQYPSYSMSSCSLSLSFVFSDVTSVIVKAEHDVHIS
ncbi:hypothetical protein DM02DRAFT_277258 [Periconia macrospinosa]|uniref:Uncharacterized protein n=1 Tax=Periconia macrospinosa TaxID=97972 RepID=A0A2V1D319_9PLEO|nr:hypothetical protein DM02DRAFT_277258 [Periconia macrospinosa]